MGCFTWDIRSDSFRHKLTYSFEILPHFVIIYRPTFYLFRFTEKVFILCQWRVTYSTIHFIQNSASQYYIMHHSLVSLGSIWSGTFNVMPLIFTIWFVSIFHFYYEILAFVIHLGEFSVFISPLIRQFLFTLLVLGFSGLTRKFLEIKR